MNTYDMGNATLYLEESIKQELMGKGVDPLPLQGWSLATEIKRHEKRCAIMQDTNSILRGLTRTIFFSAGAITGAILTLNRGPRR